MRRGEVFVDTFEGAMAEAGDILLAIRSGALSRELLRAELHGLCAGLHPGRTDQAAITVFKSVGTALEDLLSVVRGGASASPAGRESEIAYVDAESGARRLALIDAWSVPFEECMPVRGFPSYKGQRNRVGRWWTATTGSACRV